MLCILIEGTQLLNEGCIKNKRLSKRLDSPKEYV